MILKQQLHLKLDFCYLFFFKTNPMQNKEVQVFASD